MTPFLSSLLAFILAHPELLWLALTAIVSLFHFAIEPHFPRAVAFLRATGLDLPRLWAILRGLEPKLPPLPTVAPLLLVLALGNHVAGCSGAPTDSQIATGVTAGEYIGDATCAILEGIPQTDTAVTQFICSEIPKPGATKPPKMFLVKVAKADVAKFAADHCVKAGSGAPTP